MDYLSGLVGGSEEPAKARELGEPQPSTPSVLLAAWNDTEAAHKKPHAAPHKKPHAAKPHAPKKPRAASDSFAMPSRLKFNTQERRDWRARQWERAEVEERSLAKRLPVEGRAAPRGTRISGASSGST